MKASAANADAQILMMGYSPTGGGHTDRLLNVVHKSVDEGTLKPGSTVVMHIPEQWMGRDRPRSLDTLATKLKANGIHVIVAQADKSVYGYLDARTGGSDDAKIIERFATYPKRNDSPAPRLLANDRRQQINGATIGSITEARSYSSDGESFKRIPVISAKQLMTSVHNTIGGAAFGSKVRVLTDMDPYLQKAAKNLGVPDEHRVDQQNHAILLNAENPELDMVPEKSLLAKVLGGTGEHVSHIELGAKNTLSEMVNSAQTFGITPGMTKEQARNRVVDYVLEHGKRAEVPDAGNLNAPNFEGIIVNPDLRSASEVKNVVYVYAHKNTNRIAQQINEAVRNDKQGYEETLFIFCGAKAIHGANALHAGYLADGDGVTVAGAGTTGEFAYLHKAGGSKANLMVFPIAGHNEQAANVDYLERDEATHQHVQAHVVDDMFSNNLDAYIRKTSSEAGQKYTAEAGTMEKMMGAIADPSSYVQQTHDLLAGRTGAGSAEMATSKRLSQEEETLRQSGLLKANLHVIKMVFQGLEHLENAIEPPAGGSDGRSRSTSRVRATPISIKLTAKDDENSHRFDNFGQFVHALKDNDWLTRNMGNGQQRLHAGNVVLLSEARTLFDNAAYSEPDVLRRNIARLKEHYGEALTTGF
ncbi:hypothetical protein DWV00_32765 [Trinickia dinghuensis]|uniref:Uncharacterized protein n=1 Tax=Trinickia dinghuensis TaxID=2291023 RepID=A0A3D8JNJ5_9BURK|nr:hypothetical protein DWV00_32765 [Trinickia dinghuensis]